MKCDKSGNVLGNSTSTRPLVPQKRAPQQADSQPLKRQAGQAGTRAVQGINATQQSSVNDETVSTVKKLQTTVEDILARLAAAAPAPQPSAGITEEQVISLIEARLVKQQEEIQQSIQELRELVETGFVNIQTSFDSVAEWREEVTQTFSKIHEWATVMEEKVIEGRTTSSIIHEQSQAERSLHATSRLSHLSSTPSQLPPSDWQTPSATAIKTNNNSRRSFRLSDAVDFTLATIPEQPNVSVIVEDQEVIQENGSTSPAPIASTSSAKPKKQVRLSLPADYQDTSVKQLGSSPELGSIAEVQTDQDVSRPLIAFTPIASRTLFGTERSTEERFDDIIDIIDGDDTAALDMQDASTLPVWGVQSPSKLLPAQAS